MTNIYNLFKFLEDKEGTKIPLKVKFIYSPDTLTPDDLKVEGSLDLGYTTITSLPDGLDVRGNLDLGGTKITSLPNDLKVGRSLNLANTPLTKFTKEEIRKMIEDKGGEVRKDIYL